MVNRKGEGGSSDRFPLLRLITADGDSSHETEDDFFLAEKL